MAWGHRGRQALDAVVYVALFTLTVVAVATIVSFTFGGIGNWVGVKFILFFVGFAVFGIGSFMLRPVAPYKERRFLVPTPEKETRFQAAVAGLIPDSYRLPPEQRLSDGARLLLVALTILGISYLMETVLGVVR